MPERSGGSGLGGSGLNQGVVVGAGRFNGVSRRMPGSDLD